ncbi:symmetrical bis(5'-nucleosyl)-tetraphosphatase [Comamonas faecalis]|uniref:bis(5'-nucleosyl)-tetraphosphatase (symmetrical) n=1 Tax=Comamonas faecalis TaxID=1387849 RepID=A0ABP7RZ97_9BURK
MALYCIGDIQGCHGSLQRLLATIDFSPSRDQVYLLGDLVNRGPDSAAVLRQCMAHEGSLHALLGNHDLHLLATAHGVRPPSRRDTLDVVLHADDRGAMLDWLARQPLARRIEHGGQPLLMVHAGVLPQWRADEVLDLAAEVQEPLRGPQRAAFLQQMYGNTPAQWSYALQGADRLRVIVNALTRLRFCSHEGVMDFASSESASAAPQGLLPWFDVPARRSRDTLIAFGHWSTLGWMSRPDVLALDTGCVWGGALSAVRFGATLAEHELIQVRCPQAQAPGQ